jgi:hypothetical protein
MSSIIVDCFGGLPATMYQSLLVVDADSDAERIVVLDMQNLELIVNRKLGGGVFNTIVPFKYSGASELIVMIIDTDRVYGCKAVDGVKAEVIDGIITRVR